VCPMHEPPRRVRVLGLFDIRGQTHLESITVCVRTSTRAARDAEPSSSEAPPLRKDDRKCRSSCAAEIAECRDGGAARRFTLVRTVDVRTIARLEQLGWVRFGAFFAADVVDLQPSYYGQEIDDTDCTGARASVKHPRRSTDENDENERERPEGTAEGAAPHAGVNGPPLTAEEWNATTNDGHSKTAVSGDPRSSRPVLRSKSNNLYKINSNDRSLRRSHSSLDDGQRTNEHAAERGGDPPMPATITPVPPPGGGHGHLVSDPQLASNQQMDSGVAARAALNGSSPKAISGSTTPKSKAKTKAKTRARRAVPQMFRTAQRVLRDTE